MIGLRKTRSERLEPIELEFPGGTVHLRIGGPDAGVPLVCVHGFIMPGDYMMPVGHLLAAERRVVIPDLPGYGNSYQPEEIPGPEELADALVEILDRLGLASADFLGNSYGCQILAKLGVRHPGRVRRMVFVGPTVDPARRGFWRQFGLLLATGMFEDAGLALLLFAGLYKAGPRTILRTLDHCLTDRIEESLPEVRAPVLVVRGTWDFLVPRSWARTVVRLLPDARLKTIFMGAHGLNYSSPHKLCEAVRPFLDS